MMEPVLILLVLIGTVSYVAWPWLREKETAKTPGTRRHEDGPPEGRSRIEAELEELDADFHAGKVANGDYAALRDELLGRRDGAGPADRPERRE